MASFGENLRRVREEKGMTQLELAYHAEISIDSLRNWEIGRAFPKVGTLAKLARVLEVSADVLLEGIEEGETEGKPEERQNKGRKGKK